MLHSNYSVAHRTNQPNQPKFQKNFPAHSPKLHKTYKKVTIPIKKCVLPQKSKICKMKIAERKTSQKTKHRR